MTVRTTKLAITNTASTLAKRRTHVPETPFALFQIILPNADVPNHCQMEIRSLTVKHLSEIPNLNAELTEIVHQSLLVLTTLAKTLASNLNLVQNLPGAKSWTLFQSEQ